MTGADQLNDLIATSKIVICSGSGGVGKTTTAAVLAMEAAKAGRRAVVVTIDPAKRMPLWHKCHQILHEDQPYTFLLTQKYLYFFDKRIQNVKPAKLGLNYWGYNVMPMAWYVPGPMQKYKD